MKPTTALFCLFALGACAHQPGVDLPLFGDATRANIALQSVRDPAQPNTHPVTHSAARVSVALSRHDAGERPALDRVSTLSGGGGS